MNRGGVEDTRLEAKAKDPKKIPGQEQLFRGQTLLRPKTEMLVAKAKDTGGKCFQKKSLKKFHFVIFQAISKQKGLQNNFSGDLQNFNNS